mgnify:CR=1 FL=1
MTHMKTAKRFNFTTALACGVSLATLCVAAPALAQSASAESEGGGEIIVTGSRLRRDGFETPTPVTVGPFATEAEFEATNWKVGFEWDVAAASLLYFNVGDGYRPGGLNQTPPPNGRSALTHRAPTSWKNHHATPRRISSPCGASANCWPTAPP